VDVEGTSKTYPADETYEIISEIEETIRTSKSS